MSTANKTIIFLLLTFAFSWGVVFAAAATGFAQAPLAAFATLTLMMFGPALAAIGCAYGFEKGKRVQALGLTFQPNWWWLYAALIPAVLALIAVAATILLSPYHFVAPGENLLAMMRDRASPRQVAEVVSLGPYLDILLIAQVIFGIAVNAVVITFSEELGWRGYLHYLWRPGGFWRTSLTTGVIWGVWHAPAIYLFGLNYPDNRLIGIPMFIAFCTLLAPLMTLIRDRGGSTWAAGIAHGAVNAMAGYAALCLSQPQFPWVATVGIGGFIALDWRFWV